MIDGFLNLFSSNTNEDLAPIANEHSFTKGFDGTLKADAAIAIEDNKIVLAVDYDFAEAPSYVEFDMKSRKISIVQATGDVAVLGTISVPMEERELINASSKVALVTGTGEDKLLQVVSLKKQGVASISKTA